jgi:hypothetical protein
MYLNIHYSFGSLFMVSLSPLYSRLDGTVLYIYMHILYVCIYNILFLYMHILYMHTEI